MCANGTIAWSYGLLEPAEQTLYRRLGVFVGGYMPEIVEVVCRGTGDVGIEVLDGISSLVEQSLLRRAVDQAADLALAKLAPTAPGANRANAADTELRGKARDGWFTTNHPVRRIGVSQPITELSTPAVLR